MRIIQSQLVFILQDSSPYLLGQSLHPVLAFEVSRSPLKSGARLGINRNGEALELGQRQGR